MVDYVSFLSRAVMALNPNTSERREIIYDRARKAIIENFRTGEQAQPDAELRRQSAALEAAIRLVEVDATLAGAPSQPSSAGNTGDAPAEEYQDRPPLIDNRKRLTIVASALGVPVILLAGITAYSFWPRSLPEARSILRPSVAKFAEQLATKPSYIYMRQVVYYRTNYPVGTIIVDKSQNFLYVVRPRLAALRYTIAVAPECTSLVGLYHVTQKEMWPGLEPPFQQSSDSSDERLKSPLGARALDLTGDYRIHGTSAFPVTGGAALKRCIGLINDDVIDLYDRTPLESRAVVLPEG
jgi:lipoprotein-anchoring transpeptidase ErfK/SrfK